MYMLNQHNIVQNSEVEAKWCMVFIFFIWLLPIKIWKFVEALNLCDRSEKRLPKI